MPQGSVTLAERYILEEEIARGGMGVIWRARDEVLARPVAVKILHPNLSKDDAFLERFRREALAAARLAHPNIVSIYDTGSDAGADGSARNYIVMEYCGGGTLETILASGPADPDRVAAIGAVVCDALAYAHRHDIVHRDIKPANVLITDDGNLKVADFGIAKAAFTTGDLTTTGAILGTVTYLSPEQARGVEPDARSDLYALGIVLYELLAGRPPFVEESQIATAMKHIREEPPSLRSLKPGIPRSIETLVLKALAKDPADRYRSADDMGAALEAFAGSMQRGTTRVTEEPAPMRRGPAAAPGSGTDIRWLWPLAGIAAVVIALALLLPRVIGEPSSDDAGGNNRGGAGGPGAAAAIEVDSVTDFDPYGGDGEHPEEAPLAADGKPGTEWTTQDYSSTFEAIGKPGVGLLFDLADSVEVTGITISGRIGSYEVRVSDEASGSEEDFDPVASEDALDGSSQVIFDEPATGRYWLVWITDLPDGTGSASIAEVEFLDR